MRNTELQNIQNLLSVVAIIR